MTQARFAAFCSLAFAAMLSASAACAQVAPVLYLSAGSFGRGGDVTTHFESPADEDGFRKGFSFRSFSYPVSSFASGLAWGGTGGARGFSSGGLAADSAQYGYSFKGIGDTPVTLFGGVDTLRANPDVFTSLVTPGYNGGRTLATSVNAGIAFKPTSNVSLSVSAGFAQPSEVAGGDLSSRFLSGEQPLFLGGRR